MKRGTREHAAACKNKRTPNQVEIDREFIGELYTQGLSHYAITNRLNSSRPYKLSRQIVTTQIQGIIGEWRAKMLQAVDEKIADELARLNKIEREAWDAWERSKAEETKTTSEKSEGTNGRTLARVIKAGRDGDPRFLMIVGNCVTERCKLLGLYAASKVEHGNADGTPLIIPTAPAPVIRIVMGESPHMKELMALTHDTNGTD
jgi:hypothetical protein